MSSSGKASGVSGVPLRLSKIVDGSTLTPRTTSANGSRARAGLAGAEGEPTPFLSSRSPRSVRGRRRLTVVTVRARPAGHGVLGRWSLRTVRKAYAKSEPARNLAERAATEEREHELRSSLLALDAGLRALGSSLVNSPAQPLIQALQLELLAARRVLAGDDEPTLTTFDVSAIVRSWAVLDTAVGGRLEVVLPDALIVVGSASITIEVLRNLVDNARQHAAGQPVRISATRYRTWVELRVQDCGPGLPDEFRVFERGFSGGDSSGLGLYLAARLMGQQAGELRVLPSERGSVLALRFLTPVETPSGFEPCPGQLLANGVR